MFGGGFSLGRVLGFKIDVDWSWLFIFGLVVYSLAVGYFPHFYPQFGVTTNWIVGVIAALLLFASVLAHELSHSVVARRYGIDVKGITLFIFGGVAQTKQEPKTPKVEFWMAIAGPLMSFAIAAVFYLFGSFGVQTGLPEPLIAIFGYLAFINLVLGIFNLVPGFPLDGGRVLRSLIWGATGNLVKSTRYASYAGQGFGFLLIAFGFWQILVGAFIGGLWMIFIGWFLSGAARSSYEQILLRRSLEGIQVKQVMTKDVPVVTPDTTLDTFVHDYLLQTDYRYFPVTDGDRVRGMVGIEEVRQIPREDWAYVTVDRIVQPVEDECRIKEEDDAWQALTQLSEMDARRLLVMDDDHLEGMVTRENLFHLVKVRTELGV